jgi:hypothetical protein
LRETIFVELFQTVHLLVDEVFYILFSFADDIAFRQVTYIYNVVSYSWHQFNAPVGQYVDLLYLISPKIVLHQGLAYQRYVFLGKPFVDVACGDDDVARIVGVGHYLIMIIYIVVPFVKTAECYKTQDGLVDIYLTQRMPIVRIKSINNEDYYIDDHYQVMPNTNYTSDIIIATGNINKWFAQKYISLVSKTLMKNNLWRNQIEQINVLPDRGIELVPRVGNHIIYIGNLPESNIISKREQDVEDFINKKMDRLEKFYKYGLSQAGWNKYSYINIEFDNQIICTKHHNS